MKKDNTVQNRSERLIGAPLEYAPENELGVVFLFSQMAKRRRLKIEKIRAKFPDCIAYQKMTEKTNRSILNLNIAPEISNDIIQRRTGKSAIG